MIILKRTDPDKQINRWYCLILTTDLFGQPVLYRAWGSRQTTYQHVRGDPFPTVEQAVLAAQRILVRRRQHGYQEVYTDHTFSLETQGG